MPVGLGLASSHAPAVITPLDQWEPLYQRFAARAPQPSAAALETEEVQRSQLDRIQAAFATLRERIAAYQPELFIIVGGDQSEMFDRSNVPNLMLYAGEEGWADVPSDGEYGTSDERLRVTVDVETSKRLLDRLVKESEFDVAVSVEQQSLGPRGRGLPHAFFRPVPLLLTDRTTPCCSTRTPMIRPAFLLSVVTIWVGLLRLRCGMIRVGSPSMGRADSPTIRAGRGAAGSTAPSISGFWAGSPRAMGGRRRRCTRLIP